MLDMGFIPDIERIVKMVPFTRQTLFFSATMPPEIERLADQFLQNPVQVAVAAAASTAKTVEQKLVAAPKKDFEKRSVLRELIDRAENLNNAIVFCNRKKDVATLHRSLFKREYSVGALHGDMDQTSRTKTLDGFRNGDIKILVASDVAARGLDIPDVSHVFNFDVPIHAEDYVHRIGRCGRAGRDGWAFTLVTPADEKYVKAIQELTGDEMNYAGDEATFEDGKRGRGRKKPAEKKSSAKSDTANPESSDNEAPKRARRTKRADKEVQEAADTGSNEKSQGTSVAAEDKPNRHRKAEQEKPARRQKPGRSDNSSDGPTPKGLGDHVPAFMMQSAKLGD